MAKLTMVGSGINAAEHMTAAARNCIQKADRVLYVVNGGAAEKTILELRPDAQSLLGLYDLQTERAATYHLMVNLIIGYLHECATLCVVFYGHPSIFVNAAPDAIRTARQCGFAAEILPGISAEDCLFADLGVDPSRRGCQSYEATDFLARRRVFDPTVGLVLWQIHALAVLNAACMGAGFQPKHLDVLAEVLIEAYGPDHPVVIYEAATVSGAVPRIDRIRLRDLPQSEPCGASTAYVPPKGAVVHDQTMLQRLGLAR